MHSNKFYSTGELAKNVNVSVRTVRYYDSKGILKPTGYNEAGHRIYSEADLLKLKRILAFKFLGLSLDEIMSIENGEVVKDDVVKSLHLQRSIIQNKINYMKVMLDAINEAEANIASNKELDWQNSFTAINLLEEDKELRQHYIDGANLNAEVKLKENFSSDKEGWYNWVFQHIHFFENANILELGCGNGILWSKNLKAINPKMSIVLAEVSTEILNEARKRIPPTLPNFHFELVVPEHLPFPNECFDIVIANHFLFYTRHVETVLTEIYRVLKKGGHFYCSTIDQDSMNELETLIKEFDSKISFVKSKLIENFGVTIGKKMLTKYFNNVNYLTYKERLVIRDSKELLEYIYSMPGNILELIESRKKDFENYIENRIANSYNHEFSITNVSVLLECEKNKRLSLN